MSYLFLSIVTMATSATYHGLGVLITHFAIVNQAKTLLSVGFYIEKNVYVTMACCEHKQDFTRTDL